MKRVMIRIVFNSIPLKDVAELEEKLEKVLEEYGKPRIEITAVSLPPEE